MFGAMKRDFIQKTNRLRRWQSSVPKNHLPRVRIQASFILKAEGMWLIVAILSLCSWYYSHRSGHNVPINLQLNKRYSLFCSFLKKCSIIKSQSLENGLSCVFQATGNVLLQRCKPACLSTGNREQRLELKEQTQCGVRLVQCYTHWAERDPAHLLQP